MTTEEFVYYDIDYILAPDGWLDAKISNRIGEGFEVYRDDKNLAWRGIRKCLSTAPAVKRSALSEFVHWVLN